LQFRLINFAGQADLEDARLSLRALNTKVQTTLPQTEGTES